MNLNEEQIERYSRHLILEEVGLAGQEKIRAAKVLIIGVGGLGAPAALYLAAAGIGTLGLIDADAVDLSNLQRQVIHGSADIGTPKVASAQRTIADLNPDVTVVGHQAWASDDNIMALIADYDFVIDGTDSFSAKFLINDACVLAGIPYSHAGILRFRGQLMTVVPGSACLRCVFHAPPPPGSVPTCSSAGVLGVMGGVIGTLQATEALKHILGLGELLTDRLLSFEALPMRWRSVAVKPDASCALCGPTPSITTAVAAPEPPRACASGCRC